MRGPEPRPPRCATPLLKRAQEVDQILLIRAAQARKVLDDLIRLTSLAGVIHDRLDDVAGPAVMQKEHALSHTPQRRGAKFVRTRRALCDSIRKSRAHVMYHQIGEQVGLLVR